jgi:hypothetical protein
MIFFLNKTSWPNLISEKSNIIMRKFKHLDRYVWSQVNPMGRSSITHLIKTHRSSLNINLVFD